MSGRITGWNMVWLVVIITGLLFVTGCPEQGEQQLLTQQVRIAVSLADMQRDGNQIIKQVMDKRKREEKVQITWLDAKNDPKQQQKQLQQLAKQRIKAVVLQPVDPASAPPSCPTSGAE